MLHDADEERGRGGEHLLASECAAGPLEQPQYGIGLVGSVVGGLPNIVGVGLIVVGSGLVVTYGAVNTFSAV